MLNTKITIANYETIITCSVALESYEVRLGLTNKLFIDEEIHVIPIFFMLKKSKTNSKYEMLDMNLKSLIEKKFQKIDSIYESDVCLIDGIGN